MSNKECEIVRDLLVLYEDGVLSQSSKDMVDEHLEQCEECCEIYRKMSMDTAGVKEVMRASIGTEEKRFPDEEVKEHPEEMQAAQVMKKYTKNVQNKMKIRLVAILVGICVIGLLGSPIFQDITGLEVLESLKRYSSEDIHIAEIYQLKNGDIYCRIEADGVITGGRTSGIYDNNRPMESSDNGIIDIRLNGEYFDDGSVDDANLPYQNGAELIFPTKAIVRGERDGAIEEDYELTCKQIQYIGKSKKDTMTIWTRGDKLDSAPMDIEEKAVSGYFSNGLTEKARQEGAAIGVDEQTLDMMESTIKSTEVQPHEESAIWLPDNQ